MSSFYHRLFSRVASGALCAVVAATVPALATPRPTWLALKPGTIARVDIAPWLTSDEPEAALTESVRSLERNFSDDAARPDDVVYERIGVAVRIVTVDRDGRNALVHGIGAKFQAYAPIERLIPQIPVGTRLITAGGFGGFSDFYPKLDTREKVAERIATGSRLVALEVGVAPYDPDSADLVRVRVRALDGNLRGRTGWVAVAYTGLPSAGPVISADVAEKACNCRLVQFTLP